MNSFDLISRLRAKYKAPEYAFFSEVANATGANARRRADGLAMSLWPSRGLHLIGFEIKTMRSDWTQEKKNPAKADLIAKYCDYWYLVVSDQKIVIPDISELPFGWGLMEGTKSGLKIIKEAPLFEDALAITKPFLASILRRSYDSDQNRQEIDAAISASREKWIEIGKKNAFPTPDHRIKDAYEKLSEQVKQFEQASGIRIRDGWPKDAPARAGEAVKLIMEGKLDPAMRFESIRRMALQIIDDLDAFEGKEKSV